jgi:hypothetical protein
MFHAANREPRPGSAGEPRATWHGSGRSQGRGSAQAVASSLLVVANLPLATSCDSWPFHSPDCVTFAANRSS